MLAGGRKLTSSSESSEDSALASDADFRFILCERLLLGCTLAPVLKPFLSGFCLLGLSPLVSGPTQHMYVHVHSKQKHRDTIHTV